jgi:peptide/nickel transport system permease protein
VYYSYGNFVAVKEEIARRLPVTATLAVGAATVWLLIGIPVGVLAGVKRRSPASRLAMFLAIVGVSMPVFWLGQLLLYVFWFQLGWAPSSGLEIGESVPAAILSGSFILPWITVAIGYAAIYARMTRSNVIETMSEDYIRTARAKGLPERTVIGRHGLRGALTPIVTMLGLDLGTLLGGLFITEALFGLPGIGSLAVDSIARQDFPMVMGVTVLGALFIAIANLIVDVAYAALDPRVRYT